MPQIKVAYQGHIHIKPPNSSGQSWGVFRFYNKEFGDFKAVGLISDAARNTNMDLVLFGNWEDSEYGRQFKFSSHALCRPAGREGMIALISSVPGVGKVTASKLWDAYGDGAVEAIIRNPEILPKHVVDKKGAAALLADLLGKIESQLPLITLLSGIAFPKDLPERITDTSTPDPVGKITINPFWLMQFTGCGFNRCDQLRTKLGLPAYMPERYGAAVIQVFKDKSSETWIQKDIFLAEVANFLQSDTDIVRTCINNRVHDGMIVYRQGYLALAEAAKLEEQMCRLLIEKSHTTELAIIPNMYGKGITAHQATELHKAFANGGIAFLLGSAGTGKTSSAAAVMKQYKRIIACAPTGKAAQRMGHFLRKRGITDIVPTTIHRLLKARPANGNWIFGVDGIAEQIGADLLVVDEVSMLDNYLAATLLKAVSKDTLILMLGDPSQLPPVGRGTMLRDWEAWCDANPRYTYGRLTEVHRNAGKIAMVCKEIREKKLPMLDPVSQPIITNDPADNLQLVHCEDDEAAQQKLLRFVVDLQQRGTDLKRDFQVITATNAGSPAGKDELNRVLQRQINPGAGGLHSIFKVGDRVMCTANSRFKAADDRGQQIAGEEHYVANGETGYVTRSLERRIVVTMESNPKLSLYIPCGPIGAGFDLGYCCTGHKFQGSQSSVTAVMLSGDYKASMVTSVEWIYTALTRAQDLCILFTKNDTLRNACRQIRIWDRKSFMLDWFESYGKQVPVCNSD